MEHLLQPPVSKQIQRTQLGEETHNQQQQPTVNLATNTSSTINRVILPLNAPNVFDNNINPLPTTIKFDSLFTKKQQPQIQDFENKITKRSRSEFDNVC